MTLYKFKSLSNFDQVADMLINERLFSANLETLNDPMEGAIEFDSRTRDKDADMISYAIKRHKVCSLSTVFDKAVLWAHYADGFKGVCVEVEIDESAVDLHEVTYGPFVPVVIRDRGAKFMGGPEYDHEEWAVAALTRKYEDWAYEDEIRILNTEKEPFVSEGVSVKSVILGANISEMYKEIIYRITPIHIPIFTSTIDEANKVKKQHFKPAMIPANFARPLFSRPKGEI